MHLQGGGERRKAPFPRSKTCVGTPKLEVADVFRRYGDAYRQEHGASLSMAQYLRLRSQDDGVHR
jgi:hypothetical protein